MGCVEVGYIHWVLTDTLNLNASDHKLSKITDLPNFHLAGVVNRGPMICI